MAGAGEAIHKATNERNGGPGEATEIGARKKSIVGILSNVAELGASRMEETIGEASLHDATIGTGVAVDKIQALTGKTPDLNVNVVNIPLPTPEQDEAPRRAHHTLDEITRLLHKQEALSEKEETHAQGAVPRFGDHAGRGGQIVKL